MPEACQVSMQNRMSARSRRGPGHSPARAGGDAAQVGGDTAVLEERPRSPRTALLPQQRHRSRPSAEAQSPHAKDQGPWKPAPDGGPEDQALSTRSWLRRDACLDCPHSKGRHAVLNASWCVLSAFCSKLKPMTRMQFLSCFLENVRPHRRSPHARTCACQPPPGAPRAGESLQLRAYPASTHRPRTHPAAVPTGRVKRRNSRFIINHVLRLWAAVAYPGRRPWGRGPSSGRPV